MITSIHFRLRGVATAAVSIATLAMVGLASTPGTAAAHGADTGTSARPGSHPSTSTKHGPRGYYLKFTKNWDHPDRSTLSLVHDGIPVKSYRAGSGVGVTDECRSNKGWLPSGTYQVKGHQTHRNSAIKGYAIQLSDKACHPKSKKKAVNRGDLFIHSEMTKNGGQGSTEPTRWDGDRDYKSLGCIKLRPADIKDLFSRLNQAHWPKNLTLRVN
ncbi:L,D-transpeptidase [Streptomyces sp. ISL-43]|uniref:L,D-transpeptidase n=1 Tax=Streptomyces sp. ISL-43 TaxID=2819183 RepID=UPI001BEB7FF8|nr:L,D-transpeptidase [Streptomyces sp. ISL-43]MBT2451473.1 L,D-transpeptidase [Streptomyces sp. ISL-43]